MRIYTRRNQKRTGERGRNELGRVGERGKGKWEEREGKRVRGAERESGGENIG